jgi:hypothetical protein
VLFSGEDIDSLMTVVLIGFWVDCGRFLQKNKFAEFCLVMKLEDLRDGKVKMSGNDEKFDRKLFTIFSRSFKFCTKLQVKLR